MDRQLLLPLTDQMSVEQLHRKQRRHLHERLSVRSTLIEWLALLAAHGTRSSSHDGQDLSTLTISESRAMRIASIGKSGLRAAIEELEADRVMSVDRRTRPATYRINWTRLRAWIEAQQQDEPDDLTGDWSAPVRFGPARSGSVRSGPPPGVREEKRSKPRGASVSVNTGSDGPSRTKADQAGPSRTEADQTGRPLRRSDWPMTSWSADSQADRLTDWQLVAAVVQRDVAFLRYLYDQLIRLGWQSDTPDHRQRFLTLCHHCARSRSLRRRAGTLVAKVRANFDCSTTTQVSDEWAGLLLWTFDDPADASRRQKTDQLIARR